MSGDNTLINFIDKSSQKRIYNFKNKPEACVNSNDWKQSILAQIQSLENFIKSQESIDILYYQLSEVFFTELDLFLKITNISEFTKKCFKNNKPY